MFTSTKKIKLSKGNKIYFYKQEFFVNIFLPLTFYFFTFTTNFEFKSWTKNT